MGRDAVIRSDRSDNPALGKSRRRVLAALCSAAAPLGVREVAGRVGLHVNTTRFHLEGLVTIGLAQRTTEDTVQSGRPRMLYTATYLDPRTGRRSYRLLAQILTGYFAAQLPWPAEAGRLAGEAWGRNRASQCAEGRAGTADAVAQLMQTLDEIGFDPQLVWVGTEHQVLIHQCPFLEAAAEYPEVVCSVHLGMMQGVLAELHAAVQTQRLDPLVDASLCVAHLGPTG